MLRVSPRRYNHSLDGTTGEWHGAHLDDKENKSKEQRRHRSQTVLFRGEHENSQGEDRGAKHFQEQSLGPVCSLVQGNVDAEGAGGETVADESGENSTDHLGKGNDWTLAAAVWRGRLAPAVHKLTDEADGTDDAD